MGAVGDDAVSWFARDSASGALSYGGRLKDNESGVDVLDGAASVSLSADGQCLCSRTLALAHALNRWQFVVGRDHRAPRR